MGSQPAGTTHTPRRRFRPAPLTVVAAVVATLFVLLGVGTPLLGLRTFTGVDLLQSFEPWKSDAPAGVRPHLPAVSDTIDTAIPGHHQFTEQVQDGNLPSWNPFGSGGSAFGSGFGQAFYSPINVPYLVLPAWLAPGFAKLLELIVTIGGTVLFARRIGLSRAAGLLGGILFASSGFMVTWTNWPQTQVAALIPALFWAAERFAQLRTVRAAVPIALVFAAMLLGGFPAVTGYAVYAAAPYLVMRLFQLTGRSPLRLLASAVKAGAALALGAGAVAVLLLPFLAQLSQLNYLADRGQTPATHLPPLMLATLGAWRAFGSVSGGEGYWGPFNQIEGLSFLGAGALVLIGFALLRRPAAGLVRGVRAYFVAATLLAVVLGYVGGPVLGLAQKLPVFSDNPVYRIRSVLGFFLAMLAAMGYQALVAHVRRSRGRLRLAIEGAGWLVAALAAAAVARAVLGVGTDVGKVGYVREQLLWAALPAGLMLVAGTVATLAARPAADRPAALADPAAGGAAHPDPAAGVRERPLRLLALGAIPVIVAVESLSLLIPFWPRAPKQDFYPQTAAHQFLEQNLGHDRYASKGFTFFPGTNVFYGLRNATGHAFTTREWEELLLAVDPGSFATATYSRFTRGDVKTLDSPLLDDMSVRYFALGPQDAVLGVRSAVPGVAATLRPGRPVDVPVGAGGVRGIGVTLTRAALPADPYAALDVALVDTSGRTVASSSRRLYQVVARGGFTVPIAGEDAAAAGPLTARLTLRSDAPLALAPQLQVTRPDPADRLKLVFADGAVIYDRTTAEPRFRWADHAAVIPDKTRRLTVLANVRDPGRVVLDSPGPIAAEGRPATVAVLSDGTDASQTRVSASGAGYLVVADADQVDWQATVDGRTVPLVPADHALVAVPVPAGEHLVALRYAPAARGRGMAITVVALVLLAGATLWPLASRRRPERARSGPVPVDGTPPPGAAAAAADDDAAAAETAPPERAPLHG